MGTLIEIEAHPVAQWVAPGKASPDKDPPSMVGASIQGEAGPMPVAGKARRVPNQKI